MPPLDQAPTVREEPRPPPSHDPTPKVHLEATTLDDAGHLARYRVGDLLGEGGMGEVRRCRDRRIGREVAMKVVRSDAEGAFMRERFLREARVQGQLEHPCIVPVYDLGLGADGATYFTMKRVRGETLEAIIAALRAGDVGAAARWSRRKLLGAFATVCGAVEYAHARGVVHRDLKPGNIMLGDFGEVYVLDWGVARVLDVADDVSPDRVQAPMPAHGKTADGSVIGTPGYIPPEQLLGAGDVDGRADVYALGAILFELLALDALHTGSTHEAVIASTLQGADARPSARAPDRDVPPELDATCVLATQRDRAARCASARELLAAVESYLDGDRDTAQRRAMAEALTTSAEALSARALDGDDAARAGAIHEVGRALALDPGNARALGTFVRLLVEPPRETPPEVDARIRDDENAQLLAGARTALRGYLLWIALIPCSAALGVRDWGLLALVAGLIAACAAASATALYTRRFPFAGQLAMMSLNTVAIAAMGRLFGPFMMVPAVLVTITLAFSLTPRRSHRVAFAALGVAGMIAPALLDASGLVAPSLVFRDGAVSLLPRAVSLPPTLTFLALLLVHITTLLAGVRIVGGIRDAFEQASRRLHLLAWQLRQIVPHDGLGAATARPVDDRSILGALLRR